MRPVWRALHSRSCIVGCWTRMNEVNVRAGRNLIVLLLLLMSSVRPVWALSARFSGRTLQVDDGTHQITVKDVISARADGGVIHAIQKRGADYYVVFQTAWDSRPERPMGYCGAGVEIAVRWIRIHNAQVAEQQEALYFSCLENR